MQNTVSTLTKPVWSRNYVNDGSRIRNLERAIVVNSHRLNRTNDPLEAIDLARITSIMLDQLRDLNPSHPHLLRFSHLT